MILCQSHLHRGNCYLPSLYLKDTVAKSKDRYIKCTAAEIIHEHGYILLLSIPYARHLQ